MTNLNVLFFSKLNFEKLKIRKNQAIAMAMAAVYGTVHVEKKVPVRNAPGSRTPGKHICNTEYEAIALNR